MRKILHEKFSVHNSYFFFFFLYGKAFYVPKFFFRTLDVEKNLPLFAIT